jgi:hypothetical protein
MKERKPEVHRKEDTIEIPIKKQVAIFRLRIGYRRAHMVYHSTTYCENAKKLRTRE